MIPINSGRRNNHYSNVAVINQNGQLLSSIGERKYQWFLKKNLAIETKCPEGFKKAIKLNYLVKNPRILKHNLLPRQNHCVVCGAKEKLSLHHVVPLFIKTHFPVFHKEHTGQWCILCCRDCHDKAEAFIRDNSLIPHFHNLTVKENLFITTKYGYISSYNYLIKNDALSSISLKNKLKLEDIIKKYRIDLNNFPFSEKQLKDIKLDGIKVINDKTQDKIKQWINSFNDIKEIFELFKIIFMQTNPKYLPEGFLEI